MITDNTIENQIVVILYNRDIVYWKPENADITWNDVC